MAELFGLTGTPDPVNDRVPFLDASETLANQLKDCSTRTLVNSGIELQANGDSTSAIVRHTSLGYITGHIPIASPDTLANSLPAGSITGTPVVTPGASLLVQFVIASAIGANGYNVYKRRCGNSPGVGNWRGVEGWELEVSVETAGTVNLDLDSGSWEIAVQTVSDLQKGAITYVFRTDSGTVVGGAIDSATITQDTSGVLITPVISGTFDFIHVFYRRRRDNGLFGPLEEEIYASTEPVITIQNMVPGDTWFYLVPEEGEYYNATHLTLQYNVETTGVAILKTRYLYGDIGCDSVATNFYNAARILRSATLVGTTAVVKKGDFFVLDTGITGSTIPRFATLPIVPAEFQTCIQYSQEGGGLPMFGMAYLDASNNGAGLILYKNSEAANATLRLVVITAGVYSSAPVIKTLFSAGSTMANTPVWLRLAKSGTTYTAYWSLDGIDWSGTFSTTVAGTPTKISVGQFNRLAGADNTTASALVVRYLATP